MKGHTNTQMKKGQGKEWCFKQCDMTITGCRTKRNQRGSYEKPFNHTQESGFDLQSDRALREDCKQERDTKYFILERKLQQQWGGSAGQSRGRGEDLRNCGKGKTGQEFRVAMGLLWREAVYEDWSQQQR